MVIIDRIEAVEGIRRGLKSKKRGEGKTLEQFDKEMRKKYKMPARSRKVLHVRHSARTLLKPKTKK